jgi:4-hydroxy-tetrahydrodipicolinate synthase
MTTATSFGPLITAMVTPFDEKGKVSIPKALKLATHLAKQGTDTLVLAGTTGESPTLSHEEEYELFKKVTLALKGKAYIMAGTGSNCTATAIESTQKAEAFGVDATLQVVPYYNRPSQEGIYQHFKTIAKNTSLPILLYNIPGRTGRNMEPETVARLAEISNIVGIKESAGSVDQLKKIRALTPRDFMIYSGDDALTLPFMEHGACGVVSVASHCVGAKLKAMLTAFLAGNKAEAYRIEKELMPIFEVLFITSNPSPVKAALNMMGFNVGGVRLPLVQTTVQETESVKSVLKTLGLV